MEEKEPSHPPRRGVGFVFVVSDLFTVAKNGVVNRIGVSVHQGCQALATLLYSANVTHPFLQA